MAAAVLEEVLLGAPGAPLKAIMMRESVMTYQAGLIQT